MGLKQTAIKNMASNYVRYFVGLVVAFFLSPFVVHTLGNVGYGVWVLVGSLTGYMGILDFGIRPAIVKFVSKYHALGDDDKINEIINTVLVAYLVPAAITLLLSVIVGAVADRLFVVPDEYHHEMRIVILLVGSNIALGFPFGVFNAILNGLQRFDLNNAIDITVVIIRTALIVILLKMGGGIIVLGAIALGTSILEFIGKVLWSKKIFKPLRIHPKLARRETLRMVVGFSFYTFIIAISVQMSFLTDSIVIGSMISASAITFFAIGANLVAYLKQLVSNYSVVLTPMASGFDARNEFEKLRRLLIIGTRYLLILIFPITATFLLLGEQFINLWMGNEYGPASSTVLTILTVAYFGFLTQFVSGSIFMGMGKIKALAFINLSQSLANLALSILLAGPYGIYGVALGTAIPLTVYGTFILPVYICRTLQVPLLTYIKESFIPPLLSGIPFIAFMLYVRIYIAVESLVQFGVWLILAILFYIPGVIWLTLESEHRKAAFAVLKSLGRE